MPGSPGISRVSPLPCGNTTALDNPASRFWLAGSYNLSYGVPVTCTTAGAAILRLGSTFCQHAAFLLQDLWSGCTVRTPTWSQLWAPLPAKHRGRNREPGANGSRMGHRMNHLAPFAVVAGHPPGASACIQHVAFSETCDGVVEVPRPSPIPIAAEFSLRRLRVSRNCLFRCRAATCAHRSSPSPRALP